MTKWRERIINDIQTIVKQISLFVPDYENDSQIFLSDFCNIFMQITNLREFKTLCNDFDKRYRFTSEYYDYAFLWTTCDFCRLIYYQCSLEKIPLIFIRNGLREIHNLLRVSTSLNTESSEQWDVLQDSFRKEIPIILQQHFGDENQTFSRLINLIDEKGIGALNPLHIYDAIRPSIFGPPWKTPLLSQVNLFCDLSALVWKFHFLPAAFSLSRVFMCLEIKKKKFEEFQRFIFQPESHVIKASRVFLGMKDFENI
jgi:hypothetical protein